MKLKRLAAMTLAALGTGAVEHAGAMTIHVNGRQVILSGDVVTSDMYVLGDVIDRLRQQGRTIDTLVMRNSNGGSVYAGYNIGDFARRNHLTTVESGYCISACSMMFVGGEKRAFAAGDQPVSGQFIGIHGVTGGGGAYRDSSRDTPFYQYFLQAIADGDLSKTDAQLLDDAFSDHGSAYARIYDPASGASPSVYWCHADCNNPAQYKAYPEDDAYTTGFVNQKTPVATTDTLVIDRDMSGNINPNYYNAYDPSARHYVNDDLVGFAIGWDFLAQHLSPQTVPILTPEAYPDDVEVAIYNSLTPARRAELLTQYTIEWYRDNDPDATDELQKYLRVIADNAEKGFVDPSALSIGDAYGIIRITDGATWTLSKNEYGAADALYADNGRLRLAGGTLNITGVGFFHGSVLRGEGALGAPTQWATINLRSGSIVHPEGRGLDVTGNLRLNEDAALAFDVSPSLAGGQAPLRFGLFDGGDYTTFSALTVSGKSARMALHVMPGFYRPGESYALVGYSPGSDEAVTDAGAAGRAPDDTHIVYGTFRHVVRADDQGDPIAGYDIDATSGALFRPADGSLLGYRVLQSADGIALQANDPFLDPSLCPRNGCGLGNTLSAAARHPSPGLEPLLGALEFSNPAQAAHAAGQISGEGYAALRTATLDLLGGFSGALDQHVRAVASGDGDGASAAFMNGVAGMGLDGTRVGGELASMMRHLVAPDEVSGGGGSGAPTVWGRLFGGKGRLSAQGDLAGLREHTTGVMLGVDVPVRDGVLLGGSLGYGKLRANDGDSAFHGRVRALDARFYADYRYEGGYLDASLGYFRLRQTATRRIELPLYDAGGHSRDDSHAVSLHIEHGLTLPTASGIVWQPILPSLDMIRMPETAFGDKGLGDAGLRVRAKPMTDTRLGVGVQVYKRFAWGNNGSWTPHARLLLQHRFNSHENRFVGSLQGYPEGSFDVVGPNGGLNHVLVNAGLSARSGQRAAFTVDYVGDASRRTRQHGVMLGASYRW